MTTFALDLVRNGLAWLFLVYTVVAVSHYALQLVFAHRTYRRQASPAFAREYPDHPVAVDIIVPVYNEEPELLDACVRSALQQDHKGPIRVFVVDDGSPNRAALDGIYDRLEEAGATVIRSPRNVGKRHAQALALARCDGEIMVTLDSDSVLATDAVRRLTRQFADQRVGAATGFVDVQNRDRGLLTRIQRIRYWMAFNQERAAQTWFRAVMCCSGPLAAYRRDLVERVRGPYLSQMYGGVACTYGDDRHLTNLILGLGFDTVFDAGAVAYTNVPERWRQFLRQQLRWNKSFYRELVWTLPYIGSRPWFTRFDVACQVAMPLMLTLTAGTALVVGFASSPAYLLRYAALIALAATVRATYGAIRQRDPAFYLFILYGYVSAFLLMSVRVVALTSLADARWGTRGGPAPSPATGPSGLTGPTLVAATASVDASPALPDRPFGSAWRAGLMLRSMGESSSRLDPRRFPLVSGSPGEADRPTATGPCGHPVGLAARFCRACGAPTQHGPQS